MNQLLEGITEADVRGLQLEQAYQLFLSYDPPIEILQDARFGTEGMIFDLYDWYQGGMTIKRKSGMVSYRGKPIRINHIYTELERRNTKIKQWLVKKLFEQESWLKARHKNG